MSLAVVHVTPTKAQSRSEISMTSPGLNVHSPTRPLLLALAGQIPYGQDGCPCRATTLTPIVSEKKPGLRQIPDTGETDCVGPPCAEQTLRLPAHARDVRAR